MRSPASCNTENKSDPCPFCGPSSSDAAAYNSYPGRNTRVVTHAPEISHVAPHIVVVHHRQDTLKMIASMFRKLGYRNVAALHSADAIGHLSQKPCDLLFTDLDMPKPDGYQLANWLKRHHPQAMALVMTCRCHAELVDLMIDDTVDSWLYKPFTTNALNATLTGIGIGPVKGLSFRTGRQGLISGMKFDPPAYK